MQAHWARSVRLGLAAFAALVSLVAAPRALAVPFQDIVSGGPLTHVSVGNELSCQVAHTGDAQLELYPPGTTPGHCGTFIAIGGTLYGPDSSNSGGTGATPYTPVSQSGVTGAGTSSSPFRVVTVVNAGATGVQLTQTDSYISGQESFRTDITIANGSGAPLTGVLYRAGDCYLQGSDVGFGFVDPARGAAGCAANANNSPAGRIEQWFPITPGANYSEDGFSTVFSQVASMQPFPNTCQCNSAIDNGAGISWNVSVAAGGQSTFAHFTTFSPTGVAGPPPPPTTRPPTSVTQPRGSCANQSPNICITAPGDITRFGCVRVGAFVHRFGIALKKNKAGLLINRVSRVQIVYFSLDRRGNGADRKRPYFALVSGRGLRAGTHQLTADVRLKIPDFQLRRFPNRFRRVNFRKQLKFPFRTCPPGTGA
jgi:hypothetical protein